MLNVSMNTNLYPSYSNSLYKNTMGNENANSFEMEKNASLSDVVNTEECETCKNRRYQDGSDDSGVSYQTPTHISRSAAPSAVMSHELEHVYRERAKAEGENARVVAQSVMIHRDICPECGRSYVSGGTTRTTTAREIENMFSVGKENEKSQVEVTA